MLRQPANLGRCVLPILSGAKRRSRHLSQPWVTPWAGKTWLAGCCPTHLFRCGEIQLQCSRTHSPCSQLHARLAGDIAATAGGLLPDPKAPLLAQSHRFSPDVLALADALAGCAFCCGCSHPGDLSALTCCFVRQPSPCLLGTKWESGSSSSCRLPG